VTVFVDASALVAILTGEEEAQSLTQALGSGSRPATSAISVWEAAAAISRKTGRTAELELPDILAFLEVAEVEIVAVDIKIAALAVVAFDRYGRRSGHRANLNMGDCFAYAFAKHRDVVLLYKGKDFALTDVQRVRPTTV
jgi:ribonuclease VapC